MWCCSAEQTALEGCWWNWRQTSLMLMLLQMMLSTVMDVVALPRHPHRTYSFPDIRQGEFAESLSDYEISIPVRVSSTGEFLSHSLQHTVLSPPLPPSSSLRRPRRSSTNNVTDTLEYRVDVAGSDLQLTLQPSWDLLGPGLVVERRQAGRGNLTDSTRLRTDVHGRLCHFQGRIRGRPRSTVAISTCNGLHGFIQDGTEQYFIEPVKGHSEVNGDSGHPHLVYRRSALQQQQLRQSVISNDDVSMCGLQNGGDVDTAAKRNVTSLRRRHKRSVSVERNVETLVVVDPSMVEYYKNEDIENYVLTIMNMAATMYHDATIGNAINIVLVRVIYLEQDEPNLEISHHADNTLASFCKWQLSVNPKDETHPNHHDVAILLTRYNICSRLNAPCSTLGLSQVSGLCQPHRSCNINEDTGLALAFTVAHELGHNFGMQHDTPENGCESRPGEIQHVMSPQMTAEASPLIWSECSRKAVTVFLDRDWGYCLDDEPSEHPFNFPLLPPGVMYDIDHQCRLMYGPDAEFCEGIDDPCTTVWCRVDKKCLTRLEAAAAGTLCGTDEYGAQKWCFGGRCQTLGDKPVAIDGQWAEWASWTECSRSCGAGVSQSERHCNNPQPTHGGRFCLGERRRYRVCNVNTCPDGSPSFREHQCAEFNNRPYKGRRYLYEPVNTPATPCQLHCRPKGRLFSVMLRDMVVDGTPCRPGRRDLCVSGRCRVVGCDWGIESAAREDQCGVCHGDGTTCTTVKQNFDKQVGIGYVEATVIPAGARNIRVEEVAEANNYLAIRNDEGRYYLNGHWYIQWSGDYEAAGTVIHYRRDGNKESFNSPGPLKEPLHVMLLFQSQNPGVQLEYTVPLENATEKRRPEFHWKYTDWTHCTSSCGGGSQRSEVVCVEKEAGIVEERFCNVSTKPDDMFKSCNDHQCPARWWTGPWQHCSVTCGDQGTRKRTVLCVRQLGPDQQIALEDWECEDLDRPADMSACPRQHPCPPERGQWRAGPWSDICEADPCGMQTRPVICTDPLGNCDLASIPPVERRCSNATCGTWNTGQWSMCTRSCGGGVQFRSVACVGGRACVPDEKPPEDQTCHTGPCVSDDETNSSSSSSSSLPAAAADDVTPADSTASRDDVTLSNDMELFVTSADDVMTMASSVTIATTTAKTSTVSPSGAAVPQTTTTTTAAATTTTTATTTQSTTTTRRPLTNYRWMALFWDQCTKRCGGGTRRRLVRCINMVSKKTVEDEHCSSQKKPTQQDDCNVDPCQAWVTSSWQQCATPCGEGVQLRNVSCPHERLCDEEQKPLDRRLCDAGPCLQWITDSWGQCSRSCGGGVRQRHVRCVNVMTTQQSSGCDAFQQPLSTDNCNTNTCPPNSDQHLSQAAAASRKCPAGGDRLSSAMCEALRRMGNCRLDYVQRRCCRTCNNLLR